MKQKITMKIVEDFVAQHPEGKNTRSCIGAYSYFNKGADEHGAFENPDEVRPGCLFGHIVASLGGGPQDVAEGDNITAPFGNRNLLDENLTNAELDIIQSAQRAADGRATWSEALSGRLYGAKQVV